MAAELSLELDNRTAAPSEVGQFGRARIFCFAGILSVLNLYATSVFHAFREFGGVEAIFRFFGINAIIWFALFATLTIMRKPTANRPADRCDMIVVGLACILCFLPWHVLALPATLLIATWCIATGASGSASRRIGIVLLAVALSNLVGRCIMIAFGAPIVALDAQFVAMLAGVEARNNVVDFATGGRSFIVGLPCSSVHNMSLGVILWASLTQIFNLRLTARMMLWGLATAFALLLVNAVRLAMIAWYPEHFDTLHNGLAGEAFGWLSLIVAACVAAAGVIVGKRHAA